MALHPKTAALRDTVLALLDVGEQVGRALDVDTIADAAEWRALISGCTRKASLEQLQRDYLVFFNEGVGAAVEAFWQEVAKRNLDVSRKQDVVLDTLRRGHVSSPDHFYELEDHFEELQQCGKITPEQADTLNELLDRFEANPKNFQRVRSRF